jgi:hypothetical protein
VTLSLGLAVATAAVKLAEAVDSETRNLEGAAAVVLEDLVLGTESTTAGDGGGLAGFLLLDSESVLADSRPPDVSQLAGAHAVDTFDLVGADDDVRERGAGLFGVLVWWAHLRGLNLMVIAYLKDEDSIAVAALRLAGARLSTVVHEHATIEAVASSNSLHSAESRSAGRSRDAATGSSVGHESGRSSGQRSANGAGSTSRTRARAGAVAVAAAAALRGADLGGLGLSPLSPRVVAAAAPLPALAASVGAEGESKDCELSVLHLGYDLNGSK